MAAHDRETTNLARVVLALFVATIALGILLLIAFEPDVQNIDAPELVERSDDARAFLIADYFFILLYALLSSIAIWRFGRSGSGHGIPTWIRLAVVLLLAAGLVDATENTLLLSSTGSVAEGRVDAAHALAVPKVLLFVGGALLALLVNVRALRVVRSRAR